MSFFNKLFQRKAQSEGTKVGGVEDFMILIRVYYQSTIAAHLGISNLGALPDLRVFKQTYHVATLNNKLGLAEKKYCQKLIQNIYGVSPTFFTEIDASVKKRCRTVQDVQGYLAMFQSFGQDLMMLMGNLMQWKFRLPSFFREALRTMVAKKVHEVMTRVTWTDEGVRKTCFSLRKSQQYLGYSEAWMTEYVHTIAMLAKKEPRKKMEE